MPIADTIFAPASGFGRAAICVVRVSGPATRAVLTGISGSVPPPRRFTLRTLRSESEDLDRAVVVFFPGPHSFTGEDQAELHLHGGLAVRAGVLQALGRFEGCRPAEAGEFTRRAFLNGKLDLSSAEGLADLLEAETAVQRRQALRQMSGSTFHQAEQWRADLIGIAALLEAALDFSDEADVSDAVTAQAARLLPPLIHDLKKALARGRVGERIRDGLLVVIAGPPNAGKSSLLNALAGRDAAIVSPLPGTTRDAIEVRCDLQGLPVTFIDTAGLRETEDAVEQQGIVRSHRHLANADIVFWLVAPGLPYAEPPEVAAEVIPIQTKADLQPAGSACGLSVSAVTGTGISDLLDRLAGKVETLTEGPEPALTRQRHRRAVEDALRPLEDALTMIEQNHEELAAENIRAGLHAIGRLTGRVDVEHILDEVFGQFCIGK